MKSIYLSYPSESKISKNRSVVFLLYFWGKNADKICKLFHSWKYFQFVQLSLENLIQDSS